MTISNSTTPSKKSIAYDRITHDFIYSYDGIVLGYAPSHAHASERLNTYVYDLLTHQSTAEISDLTTEDADVMLEVKAEEATTPSPRTLPVDPTLPDSVTYQLGNLDIVFEDARLTVTKMGGRLDLSANDTYLLMLFFQMPHITALVQQAERQYQQHSHDGAMLERWHERQRMAA